MDSPLQKNIKTFFSLAVLVAALLLIAINASARADRLPSEEREAVAWKVVSDQSALLIDVRSAYEFSQGHLDHASNIPHDQIGFRIGELVSDKEQPIVVYCRSGNRSHYAQKVLTELGFNNVYDGGGYTELVRVKPMVCPNC